MSIEFIGSLVNASATNSFARSGGTDAADYARIIKLVRDQEPSLAGVGQGA